MGEKKRTKYISSKIKYTKATKQVKFDKNNLELVNVNRGRSER